MSDFTKLKYRKILDLLLRNNLEIKLNDIKDLEVSISKRESDINDKERDVSIRRRYKIH
jgi:hypothetical protein